jgi:hypothetical protein
MGKCTLTCIHEHKQVLNIYAQIYLHINTHKHTIIEYKHARTHTYTHTYAIMHSHTCMHARYMLYNY